VKTRDLTGLVVLTHLCGVLVALAPPAELFFSEYVEGSSYNKAIEICNGSGEAVDLGGGMYNVQIFYNGALTPGATIWLTGTVAASDVYVLGHVSASATGILSQADQLSGNVSFNGNDAVVLRKNDVFIDVIGQIGLDPGTEWGISLTSTANNTLRRKMSITAGDANGSDPFDPAAEWDGFAVDSFDGLGQHSLAPALSVTLPARDTVLVAWPSMADYWLLHATTNLNSSNSVWREIPPPYPTNGANFQILEPASSGQMFYRLHKP